MVHNTLAYLFIIPGVIAIAYDVRTRRIPNALVFTGMIMGLLLGVIDGAFRDHTLGFVVATVVGSILWSGHMIGGGDHKLFMAAGAFVGVSRIVSVLGAIAVCGGMLSVFVVVRLLRSPYTWAQARALLHTTTVPYSIAIVAGTCIGLAVSI